MQGLEAGNHHQVLLGVTGSGKTFTMAKVIERVQRPALIIAHNKTLAAQLYSEMSEFMPDNAVEYFVSYYDYYQPEAYIPRSDTYIEKDAQINDEIDRLRLAATSALFSRHDVVIIASVSCIYGLGSPQDYGQNVLPLKVGDMVRRNQVLRHLVDIYYERNDNTLQRAKFRVRGDVLEVQPAYSDFAYRISFWGDEIERITEIDTLTGEILADHDKVEIFPAKHFITPQDKLTEAIDDIESEMEAQVADFERRGKLLEAQRIGQRTRYDLEDATRNRLLQRRGKLQPSPGATACRQPPVDAARLLPADWLVIIDESHMTIPQCAVCTPVTAHAKKCWWVTGSVCPAHWTTARSPSTSSRRRCGRPSTLAPRPAPTRWNMPSRWWNRSFAPPVYSIR
ncbi:MAG: DEAD/DEAH box helicase family protein [Caldilineaceae bacterium]